MPVAAGAAAVLLAACATDTAVQVDVPTVSGAARQVCRGLTHDLPQTLDGRRRRAVTPASDGTAAWGDPPVILRCGVALPGDYARAVAAARAGRAEGPEVAEIDGVTWFLAPRVSYVFTAVERAVAVEVRVPASTPRDRAVNPLADLAGALARHDPVDEGP